MIDTADNISELDLEQDITTDEQDCEITVQDDEDTAIAYDDHLSEAVKERIRGYIPRHIQHAAEATEDYCEVLTERPDLVDGTTIDRIGAALVEPKFADQAQVLQGILDSAFVSSDQLLELSYRYTDTGEEPSFFYTLTLDGKYLKSFKSSALAHLCFSVATDQKPGNLHKLIQGVIRYFHKQAEKRGENRYDTCSDDFTAEVTYLVSGAIA